MSVSAIFGAKLVVPPPSAMKIAVVPRMMTAGGGGLVIECSSRPQKKATKHHMKTRPHKSSPSDIKRRPTVYPPLPPLPPEWSLLVSDDSSSSAEATPEPQLEAVET